jgi:hypothetical protein
MTDIFKCRKSGTQCCAPKSVIREILDQRNPQGSPPDLSRNDTASPVYPNNYRPSPLVPSQQLPGPVHTVKPVQQVPQTTGNRDCSQLAYISLITIFYIKIVYYVLVKLRYGENLRKS